jgi:hypothetical protein
MSDPVEIENSVEDPPFGWTSRYQAVLNDDRIDVRLRIKLKSDQRIPLKDTLKIRAETEESVEHYFNGRFEMIDRDGRVHFLTVKPEFVSDSPDLIVRLHPGKGRSNLNHWFVDAEPIVRAHEVGHALGLKDEYIDRSCENRASAEAAGVFRDHSLMGNFFGEGIDLAELKPRHGEIIARRISQSLDIPLTMRFQQHVLPNDPGEIGAACESMIRFKQDRTESHPVMNSSVTTP